jgi:hypothetical protein
MAWCSVKKITGTASALPCMRTSSHAANHVTRLKVSVLNTLINRLYKLPVTDEGQEAERKMITEIAISDEYEPSMIDILDQKRKV